MWGPCTTPVTPPEWLLGAGPRLRVPGLVRRRAESGELMAVRLLTGTTTPERTSTRRHRGSVLTPFPAWRTAVNGTDLAGCHTTLAWSVTMTAVSRR